MDESSTSTHVYDYVLPNRETVFPRELFGNLLTDLETRVVATQPPVVPNSTAGSYRGSPGRSLTVAQESRIKRPRRRSGSQQSKETA
jgi:hypothetical protein